MRSRALNMHVQLPSGARNLTLELSLPLLPYVVYECSKGCANTGQMRMLV